MNLTRIFVYLRPSALVAAALVLCAASHAQDVVVDSFDSADESLGWQKWWGSAPQTYEFDASVDAKNNAASGSLKATIQFDVAQYTGDNQFALVGSFPDGATLNGTQYKTLAFDIKWDPTSPQRPFADFGALDFGFRKSDFSQIWLTPASPLTITAVTTNNGWLHVEAPIDPTLPGLSAITGIVFKMWSGDPSWGQTGVATFWLDNIKLTASNQQIPPPTLSIQKAQPGLQLFASQGGSPYQRQNIRTKANNYTWVGASQPVTYSLTIKDYPDTNHTGFQTHLFLVPGEAIPNFESSPDYNEPNLIFLDIQNNASGGAFATLRYKVNQPSGNTMLYNSQPTNGPVGVLGGVASSQPTGTWSLTFSNDTGVTLTAPNGTNASFQLPSEAAALFAGPLYAYFGVQPNSAGNIYQSALLSGVSITGVQTPITENFTGMTNETQTIPNLDPEIWERVAENAAGVVLVPPNARFWINATVPADNYVVQTSRTLTPGSWQDVPAPTTQIGNQLRTIVTSPATGFESDHAFFRMIKPAPPQQP